MRELRPNDFLVALSLNVDLSSPHRVDSASSHSLPPLPDQLANEVSRIFHTERVITWKVPEAALPSSLFSPRDTSCTEEQLVPSI